MKKKKNQTECYFTKTGTAPNYKDILILRRFVSDRGKILPQDETGLTAKNQRRMSQELKKARFMALIPFTDKHSI